MTLEDLIKKIAPMDETAMAAARARQNVLTKPQGSLGRLESLSIQLAGITGNPLPQIQHKIIITMAGDHGVVAQGVSAYPQEVTPQMVLNFLRGGAAINVLAQHIGARVVVVDMGVATEMEPHPDLVNKKIAPGTEDIARGPAMSREQASQALLAGAEVVEAELTQGLDILGTGDMGIGNTTPSAAIAAAFTGRSPAEVVGRGTGVDDAGLSRKIVAVQRALTVNRPDPADALDVLTQAVFTRPEDEPSHRPEECRLLPIEQKESYRWLQAFKQTLALAPEGVEVITVCDREADIYEIFAFAQKQQARLLVRASSNRALQDEEVRKLWPKVEGQAIAGYLSVHIPGNDKRQARQATVSVCFASVTLRPPWRPNGLKLPAVTLNAVLVREENPPADVDEPIEWLLLTNTAVTSFEEAYRIIGWYCGRWQIEVFHKVLKSGCQVEACRLETADRLYRFVALMSVIAWRLHWMTYINRCQPDLPCTVVLTTIEWEALYMRIHKSSRLPDTVPTIHQAVRWIAQLGGFLGRKSDGEPGVTTLWRGWQRLQDMAATWHLVKEQTQLVGNR